MTLISSQVYIQEEASSRCVNRRGYKGQPRCEAISRLFTHRLQPVVSPVLHRVWWPIRSWTCSVGRRTHILHLKSSSTQNDMFCSFSGMLFSSPGSPQSWKTWTGYGNDIMGTWKVMEKFLKCCLWEFRVCFHIICWSSLTVYSLKADRIKIQDCRCLLSLLWKRRSITQTVNTFI